MREKLFQSARYKESLALRPSWRTLVFTFVALSLLLCSLAMFHVLLIQKSDTVKEQREKMLVIAESVRRDEDRPKAKKKLKEDRRGTDSRSDQKIRPQTRKKVRKAGKAKKKSTKQFSPPLPQQDIKVPYPVILLSLPKSGTTSVWRYFLCGLGRYQAVHYNTRVNASYSTPVGQCMHGNYNHSKPLLQNCGPWKVWTDIGYVFTECFYPSVHALEELYKSYPKATFLLVIRNTTAWMKSISRFNGLRNRWGRRCPGFPSYGTSDEELMNFYDQHTERIRQFAKSHPSITYVEVPSLEAADTARLLEEQIGIDAHCWEDFKPDNLTYTLIKRQKHQKGTDR